MILLKVRNIYPLINYVEYRVNIYPFHTMVMLNVSVYMLIKNCVKYGGKIILVFKI